MTLFRLYRIHRTPRKREFNGIKIEEMEISFSRMKEIEAESSVSALAEANRQFPLFLGLLAVAPLVAAHKPMLTASPMEIHHAPALAQVE
jgi:hypothetical protein